MRERETEPKALRGAWRRLVIAFAAGVVAGALAWVLAGPAWGVLWGMTVEGAGFVVLGWVAMWPATAKGTRVNARRDEFRPALEEILVLVVATAAVLATLVLGSVHGQARIAAAVITLAGVFLQWAGLHAMYAARYAFEYYADGAGRPAGGIDFNTTEPPCYRDFLYFSYNLGMTYQVSDNNVSSTRIRAVVLRHCLVSFVFALLILATTVNVVTGVFTAA